MATPGTDRQRAALIALAVVSVALTALSFRILNAAVTASAKPIPTADLQNLSAYLAPLPDSSSLAETGHGTMVGERDPFGFAAVTVDPVSRGRTTAVQPKGRTNQRWVVSSILFEDSRRSAIVNNAWVSVGDKLDGGAQVTAIERKHVVVTDANGVRHIVPIQGGGQ